MNNFFRALIAGWGAKKLGGGCLSTVIIFVVIYTLLGKCNQTSNSAPIKPVPSFVKAQPVNSRNISSATYHRQVRH